MAANPANQGYALPAMTATVSRAAAVLRAASIGETPGSYEIQSTSRSVIDQGKLVCCVSCALGSAMEILHPGSPALAPLFHYHVARFEEIGGANADGFLFLDNALATLTTTGICRKDLHPEPYTDEGAAVKPSNDARADALTRALGRRGVHLRYLPVSGPSRVVWICEQLRQERPVVIGFQLPMSYRNSSFLDSSFAWLDPDSSPRSPVGHCVLATGYNDLRGVHIQDSHGRREFNEGRWWMGYRVVDSSIFHDAYSLVP